MALLLVTHEAGAADNVFERCVGLSEKKGRARNAAAMNFVQNRVSSCGLETTFERAAIGTDELNDVVYADLVVAVAPNVVQRCVD